jgi:hypothetical protein
MTEQRPTGVTILFVLRLIGSVLSLIFGLGSVFLGSSLRTAELEVDPTGSLPAGPTLLAFGIIAIIIGLAGFIAAYGLFTLKLWGWWWAAIVALMDFSSGVTMIIDGSNIGGGIVVALISFLTYYYLTRPNVKRAFGKA